MLLILNLLTLATALANLFLGLLVLVRSKNKLLSVSFFVFSLIAGLWVFSNYYFAEIGQSVFVFRTQYALGGVLSLSALPWVLALVGSRPKTTKVVSIYFAAAVMFLLPFIDGLIVKKIVETATGQFDFVTGSFFNYYSILVFLSLVLVYWVLISSYISSRGIKREQLKFVNIGIGIFAVIALSFGFVLPLFGVKPIVAFDAQSSIIWVGFAAYAIIAHRLFDIRFIIKRAVVYSVLLAFVLITYALVVSLFSQVFGGEVTFGTQSIIPNLIAAVMIAFGFDPLRRWLQRITDRYLFKGEYDPRELAAELARMMANVVNLDEALDSMMDLVTRHMRISRIATVVIRKIDKNLEVKRVKSTGYSNVVKLEALPTGSLIQYFIKSPRLLMYDELKDKVYESTANPELHTVLKQLEQFHASIALPLHVKGLIIGILLIGEKLSGDNFSHQDIDTLELIGSQTALSIEKAQFYEEDKLKSEFISIASHELLTPTAAIEGYLSMALDEKMPQTKVQQTQYIQRAYDSSRRLADLVKDLLSISRIESGRMKISPSSLNIITLVDQAVAELQVTAKEKGLTLEFIKPIHHIPNVLADPDRIMQVCINLINNSIKYTPKGGIKVTISAEENMVMVTVTDTGIGIAKEDQQHLFEKFHRIDNPATAGIMGTGLGLYIVKNIITLLNGEVKVKSTAGKGSEFNFTLPVAK